MDEHVYSHNIKKLMDKLIHLKYMVANVFLVKKRGIAKPKEWKAIDFRIIYVKRTKRCKAFIART